MKTTPTHRRTRPPARAFAATAWPIWLAAALTVLTVLGADIAGRMHAGAPMTFMERWLPRVHAP
jgi:hypothetical protein